MSTGQQFIESSSTFIYPQDDIEIKNDYVDIIVPDEDFKKGIVYNIQIDEQGFRKIMSVAYSGYSLYKKEGFYITAIRNLIRKTEYLQLLIQLYEEQISEQEFDQELEENPDKYINNIGYLESQEDVRTISEIVARIGKKMMVDEVAELFSIDIEDLERKARLLTEK